MSPTDIDAYFGAPDLFTPQYEEVHISIAFTWDLDKGRRLADAWQGHGKVKIGGVAIDGETDQPFVAGEYLRQGITITSRGCSNACSFCMVRRGLIEFDTFPVGNVIQDNNFLACSSSHKQLVYKMLRTQKQIEFKGGLDKKLMTPEDADDLRGLRIKTLWLACDQQPGIEPLRKAVEILQKAGFTRSHLYCYVLIGNDMAENESRLKAVWDIGCMPFAQLYRDADNRLKYSKEWKQLQRTWSRPAATRAHCKVL